LALSSFVTPHGSTLRALIDERAPHWKRAADIL
jgi:hypothetical protein